ncbi:MAG: histidinol-phosphatase [Muribaculaceae bacterium]|nr:histidinol-phosphatase [Muribaculaceae bacterium]
MTDIKDIISSTRRYNLHTHTQFCDGRTPMASMVERAVKEGFEHLGFTPHSPIPFDSSCNMKAEAVKDYITEFNRLKNLYDGKINLYLSMEIDFLGDRWGSSHPYFGSIPLDYRLSSVHFIPSRCGEEIDVDGRPWHFADKMHRYFEDDIRYVVDTFYNRTLRMIEMGKFDILGHFDKIGFNASAYSPGIEETAWYKRHIDNVIDAILPTGIVVEVNTKSWLPHPDPAPSGYTGVSPRLFPSPTVIKRLVSAGIPLAVNSDAHFIDRLQAGRQAAFEVIDSAVIS